jgi:Tol biopolymer transport system component
MIEDIRVVNLDGKNAHVAAAPPDTKSAFSLPAWSLDGTEIWFTSSSVSSNAQFDEVDRVSVAGGTPSRMISGARAAVASPDGKKIAFLRLDYSTFRSSLWLAQADGSNPRQLMDDQVFVSIQGPRFSPDSQSIAFAASGVPQKQLPVGQGSRGGNIGYAWSQAAPAKSCLVRFLFTCWLNTASAHGLPWDLWLVNLDGTKFERLTQVGADSPYPTWSPDGKFVAFMDFTGMYVVNRQTKEGYLVSMNGGHGALDWH